VRSHQHLAGLTPTEAWCGVDPYQTAPRSVEYVREWDGAHGVLSQKIAAEING
jgi:putative transposase